MLAGRGGVFANFKKKRQKKFTKPVADDALEYDELISVQKDEKMRFK